MKQMKTIQQFTVGVAHYYVNGIEGDKVLLRIDYQNNTYALEQKSERMNESFQLEVSKIAQDLLRRKHGVNFAEK